MASSIRIDRAGIQAMTKTDIESWVRKVSDNVVKKGRAKAPGRIGASIRIRSLRSAAYRVTSKIGTQTGYGLFPEEGTGIYGPNRRRITPKTAKVLVFRPRGSATLIFRRSVKGQKPQHYLRDALEAAVAQAAVIKAIYRTKP